MPYPLLAAAAPAIGAAVGAVGSWFSGKQAADAARENYKHRYQWQVKDLKKAGLNPMLAVQNSPGSVAQPSFENIGEGALKGWSAAQQTKLVAEQLQSQRAITNKTIAEGERVGMENTVFAASPLYQDAIKSIENGTQGGSALASTRYLAETEKVQSEVSKVKAEIAKLDADRLRTMSETERLQALTPLLKDYQSYINAQEKAGVARAEADEKFFDTLGSADKWGPGVKFIIQTLMQIMRSK